MSSGAALNDGNPHDVVATRSSDGTLEAKVDDVLSDFASGAAQSFDADVYVPCISGPLGDVRRAGRRGLWGLLALGMGFDALQGFELVDKRPTS